MSIHRSLGSGCRSGIAGPSEKVAGRFVLGLLATALVLSTGIGWSQPVPDTILLPDSLGPLRPPYHLAFGSSTNNIYVASESSDIIVVDGETFRRIKRIYTGTPVGGAPLLVSQHNKLYCSYPQQGRIGIIDCATNNVVGSITVGTRPTLLDYSNGSDELYCGDSLDSTVTVIGCAGDTVVSVIEVGDSLTALAYDPTSNKVYAATAGALVAIDCSADTVVAAIDEVRAARSLCVNRRRQKLYAVGPECVERDTVFVVSTPRDSLTGKMWSPGGEDFLPGFVCYEAADRIYGVSDAGGWSLQEFDCAGDTYVRNWWMSDIAGRAIACDTVRGRLYYLGDWEEDGYVIGLDCTAWEIVSETYTELCPAVMELDQDRSRLLCATWWDQENVLSVYDCTDDSLERRAVPLQGWQCSQLCHNASAGKLYYLWGFAAGGIGIVDEQSNKVVDLVALPYKSGSAMAYSRTSGKLYCGTRPGLAVLDGTSDSLLRLVDLGGFALQVCWYPDSNKLYCFVYARPRYYIAVLDCYTDSVVREIELYSGACRFEPLPKGLMVCDHGDGLMLIDCRMDSVLKDTAIPGNIYDIAHSSNDKFYMIHHYTYDRLEVLSASTLSSLAVVDWPYSGHQSVMTLACSDSTHKLYWFAGDSILVIDTRGDTVLKRMKPTTPLAAGCFDHTGRYAFCFKWDSIAVYDTRSDSLVVAYPMPCPCAIIPDPERGRVFVGCLDAILVCPDTPVVAVGDAPSSLPRRLRQTVLRATDIDQMKTWTAPDLLDTFLGGKC
jgi:DNA-binding beta-propeller fold protein YncE